MSDSCDEVSAYVESQPCPWLTPEAQCWCEKLGDLVQSMLDELPEKFRRAYVLKQFWDFNYQEIASDMGLAVSMIEKYVERASTHLRNSVTEATIQ